MKMMRLQTTVDNAKIPADMALLYVDDSGWVGTNNGWPHVGQPALYPIAQAEALSTAWNYIALLHPALDEMPHPEVLSDEARAWFDLPNTK